MPRLAKRCMKQWLRDPSGVSDSLITGNYNDYRLPTIDTQTKTYGTVTTLHGDRYYQEYTP